MQEIHLTAQPLTAEAFRPFGDVIEAAGEPDMIINAGRCGRFHNLARVVAEDAGSGISIFVSEACTLPARILLMERHPIGSQAFIPMTADPFLVVVAEDDNGRPGKFHAFLTRPGQGVNYLAGTWHAPLLNLAAHVPFAVVDRIGAGKNLEEVTLETPVTVTLPD